MKIGQAFYDKVVAPRLANMVAQEMRIVCGVQAPTKVTKSGRIVAATPATPGAPPRRVTGRFIRSIRVVRNRIYVGAPYAARLEAQGHEFVQLSIKRALKRSRSSRAVIKG